MAAVFSNTEEGNESPCLEITEKLKIKCMGAAHAEPQNTEVKENVLN